MTRATLDQMITVRPEESDAIQLATIAGRVDDVSSRAAQIIRTYYLTDEIRGHMRRILASVARGNAPSPNHLECNAWLLDAGIGAGKSHFLAFLMVLLTQKESAWVALIDKENELAAKWRLDDDTILQGIEKKKHLVVPIDLTNEPTDRSLGQILVTNMKLVYQQQTGDPLKVEPDEQLIDWFYERPWREHFQSWLRAKGVDDKKENILRKNYSPKLARSLREYCAEQQIIPQLNTGWDESLRIACINVLSNFDGGTVFLLDELSRYMARRKQANQEEDDITTLQRASRNFREEGLQLWLVATENVATSKEVTQQIKGPGSVQTMNLRQEDFGEIVLYRCRTLSQSNKEREAALAKIEVHWAALRNKLNWVNKLSLEDFVQVFPFEPTLIDLTQHVCEQMAETRTGIQILHSCLRHHASGNRLITADMVFDELEGKVALDDPRANLFSETAENRAVYGVYQDIAERVSKTGEIPDKFKPKAAGAVKALVLLHFARRSEFATAEDLIEILSEEWSDSANRTMAVINFTGVLDKLPTISHGHVEKENGGFRFSVEGQVSIKPDWDAEIESLKKQSNNYDPRTLLRQLVTTESDLRDAFFGGLLLDSGSRSLSFKGLNWKGFAVKGVGRLIDLTSTSKFDPPNKLDNNQDFALYITIQSDLAKSSQILASSNDARILLWCAKPFGEDEIAQLISFESLLDIRKRYAKGERRDDAEKLAKAESELNDRKPKIIAMIKSAYINGTLKTRTQTLSNVVKADMQTALTGAVPSVLDDAYREHSLSISGNQQLDDTVVLKLANGLVRYERYDSRIPGDAWEAAKNFAKHLELTSNTTVLELNISSSTYTERIKKQLEEAKGTISFDALKKRYCDVPHGLSPRLLSLYLLALARKAEVVLEAKGGITVSKNTIENGVVLNGGSKNVIDEIVTVHRSKAPEPWDKILEIVNVLLYPIPTSAIRSDENYAGIARDIQKVLTVESSQFSGWKARLENFAVTIGAESRLSSRFENLPLVFALTDLDKNPSRGLETLWTTIRDIWGDDLKSFTAVSAEYRDAKAFFGQRKEDAIVLDKRILNEIPEADDATWHALQQAKASCINCFDIDHVICNSGARDLYEQAQSSLRQEYAIAYTQAHAAYYQEVQTNVNDLIELLESTELSCLSQLEAIAEIGGGASAKAQQAILAAIGKYQTCNLVIDSQLKSSTRCKCDVALTDVFKDAEAGRCLETIDDGLGRVLSVLQSPEIKSHLLMSEDAEQQTGLNNLLTLPPHETKQLIDLATPIMISWIGKVLSAMRSIEITLSDVVVPRSFTYEQVEPIVGALKGQICRLVDEAIDKAGFRADMMAGKPIVIRIVNDWRQNG